MSKTICFAILLFAINFATAQKISISADRNNVLYVGVGNPLTISVDNLNPDDIIVKVNKGQLYGGTGTAYVYQGFEPGYVIFTILSKADSKEIGMQNFRVKNIPDPIISLDKAKNGIINKADLMTLQNLQVRLDDFDYNVRFSTDSFRVTIFHTDNCTSKEFFNMGNLVSEELRKEFTTMKKNDLLLFRSVFVKGPDGNSKPIAPAVFTIAE